jgi:hypothetical protein
MMRKYSLRGIGRFEDWLKSFRSFFEVRMVVMELVFNELINEEEKNEKMWNSKLIKSFYRSSISKSRRIARTKINFNKNRTLLKFLQND